MKICLINNLYKPFNRGGAENIVELTAAGLKADGHDVFIITSSPKVSAPLSQEAGGLNLSPLLKYNLKIYRFGVPNLSSYYNLNRLSLFLRFFWHLIDALNLGGYFKVKKILLRENPDLVITHNLKGLGYLTVRAIKRLNINHYHTLHDIQLLYPSGLMVYGEEKKVDGLWARFYQWLNKRLFNGVKVIISPSDWLLQEHLRRGFFTGSKKLILPNPILSAPSEPESLREEKERIILRFLYVGQVEKHKGILFLIENFKFFLKYVRLAELTLVGDGSELKAVGEMAVDCPEIKILGRQTREEVAYLMKRADCLIVPSLCYENSPTVIYEAFISGLPVLASSLGGSKELLAGDCGLLFRPADRIDFGEKLEWLSNNEVELKKMAARAKSKAANYKLDFYINKILNF